MQDILTGTGSISLQIKTSVILSKTPAALDLVIVDAILTTIPPYTAKTTPVF